MEGSRPFDSELDFDHPRRNRPSAAAAAAPRDAAPAPRGAASDEPPKRAARETLARIAWALPWIAFVVTIASSAASCSPRR